MNYPISSNAATRARVGVAILLLAISSSAAVICWHRGADARRYWHRLEERSVAVAREFLEAAAAGDSAAIAATASDSMVVWVRREGIPPEMGAMAAAARQFERKSPRVYVYGSGAMIAFDYTYQGTVRQGGVWTGLTLDRLVVTGHAVAVKVD